MHFSKQKNRPKGIAASAGTDFLIMLEFQHIIYTRKSSFCKTQNPKAIF